MVTTIKRILDHHGLLSSVSLCSSGNRRSARRLPLHLVVGRPAGPSAAAAPVAASTSVALVPVAAIAATVTVVVPVFVPVLMVRVASFLIGRGGAGRRPVAGISVVPARLAFAVLSLLLGRVRAAAGVLGGVRIGGAAPHPLGAGRGFPAGGLEVFVIIQEVTREFVIGV
jgi:hypothetical protein